MMILLVYTVPSRKEYVSVLHPSEIVELKKCFLCPFSMRTAQIPHHQGAVSKQGLPDDSTRIVRV